MSDVIDRVNRLEVYNKLLKKPYMSTHELAMELNKSYEEIELYIASLRKMYKEDEIESYVYGTADGYYLEKDKSHTEKLNNEPVISNYRKIDLKEITNKKFEKSNVDVIDDNKDIVKHNNEKTLTLDLKKQQNNNVDSIKINIVDKDDVAALSLTICLS